MSLFYCTCAVALWTISLKSCLPTYIPTRRRFVHKFQQCGGTLSFLLLVWGVVSKKFSKFIWFDLATTKF